MSKRKNKPGAGRPREEAKREAFALWWSLPKAKRVPKGLYDWMEENDVSHASTWRWRKEPEFRQKVLTMRLELAEDSMTDVIQGLTNKAKEGELGQAKFLLELLGDYLPKSELNVVTDGGSSAGISESMIEFAAEEMLNHPKMVEMPLDDLIFVMKDILLEE